MDFSSYQSQHDAKMTHLKMLIQMATVDGHDHEFEDMFIRDVAKKLDLTEDDVVEAEHYPDDINHALPKEEHERMSYLYHLLFLMGMDGKVTQAEIKLCQKLGFQLGVRPSLIDELIDILIAHLRKGSPAKDMLQALQKYMN